MRRPEQQPEQQRGHRVEQIPSGRFGYQDLVNSVVALAVLAILVAAEKSWAQTPDAPPAAAAEPKSSKLLEPLTEELFFQGLMDPFDYVPRGRKDPFAQPIPDRPVAPGSPQGPLLPLQRFEVEQLKLIGIIWDVKRPRAMISDPTGKVHIVGPNTKIGTQNGYIAVIREGEIVIVDTMEENGRLVSSARIFKLAK